MHLIENFLSTFMEVEFDLFWPDADLTFTMSCENLLHTIQWTQLSNALAKVDQKTCVVLSTESVLKQYLQHVVESSLAIIESIVRYLAQSTIV